VVGRYANRIKRGQFWLRPGKYPVSLDVNQDSHHMHGGSEGFDRKVWKATVAEEGCKLTLSYLSHDREMGYPGEYWQVSPFWPVHH